MSHSNGPAPADERPLSERLAELAAASVGDIASHYRRSTLFSAPCLGRARELLVDLWLVGVTHGVQPSDWSSWDANITTAVLDVVRYEAPQVGEKAEPVVTAALAAAVKLRGEGAASRRDLFSIYLHETSSSLFCNPLRTYGGEGFVLSLDREIGWSIWLERAGRNSRSVSIRSGFDEQGIEGAVQCAIDANEGRHGDSLFERE